MGHDLRIREVEQVIARELDEGGADVVLHRVEFLVGSGVLVHLVIDQFSLQGAAAFCLVIRVHAVHDTAELRVRAGKGFRDHLAVLPHFVEEPVAHIGAAHERGLVGSGLAERQVPAAIVRDGQAHADVGGAIAQHVDHAVPAGHGIERAKQIVEHERAHGGARLGAVVNLGVVQQAGDGVDEAAVRQGAGGSSAAARHLLALLPEFAARGEHAAAVGRRIRRGLILRVVLLVGPGEPVAPAAGRGRSGHEKVHLPQPNRLGLRIGQDLADLLHTAAAAACPPAAAVTAQVIIARRHNAVDAERHGAEFFQEIVAAHALIQAGKQIVGAVAHNFKAAGVFIGGKTRFQGMERVRHGGGKLHAALLVLLPPFLQNFTGFLADLSLEVLRGLGHLSLSFPVRAFGRGNPAKRTRRPAPGCSAAGRQASHGPASGGGRLHGEMQKGLLFLSFSIIHGQSRQFFKDFLKVWRENCGAALQREIRGLIMERDAQGHAMPANGTPTPKEAIATSGIEYRGVIP